jgi:hypothetical protein
MKMGFGAVSIAAVLALAVHAGVWAAPPPADDQHDADRLALPLEGTVTNPDWDAQPNGDDLAHLYPPLAQMLELPGRAVISCGVGTDGALFGCKVDSETPIGLGFGYATLLAAVDFHMKPSKIDGRAVKGHVTIPLTWKLGSDTSGPLAPQTLEGPPPSPDRLALARRMILASDLTNEVVQNMDKGLQRQLQQVESNGSPAPAPDQQQLVLKLLHQGAVKAALDLADHRARMLATSLSAAELASAVQFMESPAGRAVAAQQHSFSSDGVSEGQRLTQTTRDEARAAYCKLATCTGQGGSHAPSGATASAP